MEASGTANQSAGAASVFRQATKTIGWKLGADLYIERRNGGTLHLTEGEDGLFDHMLRADLRQTVWLKDTRMNRRTEFDGIRKGVGYEATVKPMREKIKPRKDKNGVRPTQTEKEADGVKQQAQDAKCQPTKGPYSDRC